LFEAIPSPVIESPKPSERSTMFLDILSLRFNPCSDKNDTMQSCSDNRHSGKRDDLFHLFGCLCVLSLHRQRPL
jgi:hypothetical protein